MPYDSVSDGEWDEDHLICRECGQKVSCTEIRIRKGMLDEKNRTWKCTNKKCRHNRKPEVDRDVGMQTVEPDPPEWVLFPSRIRQAAREQEDDRLLSEASLAIRKRSKGETP